MGLMTALLLGLATVMSVSGSLDGSSVHGYAHGRDYLAVVLPDGTRCVGNMAGLTDLGSLYCPDGRLGSFHWQLDDAGRGSAVGTLDGKPLELSFQPS